MNAKQLRIMIVKVLTYLSPELPSSSAAVELLMLTACTESACGHYTRQVNGPALGIFQMEPRTEKCIFKNYLSNKPFYPKILNLMYRDNTYNLMPDLEFNMAYAIAMTRVYYFRVPKALPEVNYFDRQITYPSVQRLAQYWKQYYNTPKGKGTVEKAIKDYYVYCKSLEA